ncbi:MAG TPA: VWA domain-containing protein [Lacunisphaera sp.]
MNMNQILPDDPRLTAYAFNEMAAEERVEFEKLLSGDAAARKAVEEIRAAGSLLMAALEHEPAVAEPIAGRSGIGAEKSPSKVIRFPQFYYMVSGLAAACFAVFFVYWQHNQPVVEAQRKYVEVDLTKFKQAEADNSERKTDDAVAVALPTVGLEPVITMGREVPAVEVAEMPAPPLLKDGGLVAAVKNEHEQGAARRGKPVDGLGLLSPNDVRASILPQAPTAVGRVAAPAQTEAVKMDNFIAADYYAGVSQAQNRARANAPGRAAEKLLARQELSFRKMAFEAPREMSFNTEAYGYRKDNDYLRVADHPLSTFSIDVDTASYANVRRFLTRGQRPPADAVRIEELVNYFPYRYAPPTGNAPFAAHLEVASAPWAPEHRLVRIGLKGREVSDAQRPAANLVFLIDVSGSMQGPNRLPLVKQSLRLLVDKLRADDRVALAVYAGSSGLALPSTPASRKAEILEAIDRLDAGGSTNGAMGIHLAYDVAKSNFISGGVNRVILATDGDFNVGATSEGELVRLIEEKAKSGVFLSVLGFGMGNLKDGTLEQLADKGNGNYAYIDSLAEAKKSLVEQAGGTLVTIAKDVKIQVEFNPAQVTAYRLIGYENRLLAKEDFNNDKVDAGEIGAGHTVTALYEVVPAGAELPGETPAVDELKYRKVGTPNAKGQTPSSNEMLTVKIRYKEPAGDASNKLEFALRDTGARFEDASEDFKFAAAVAGFGLVLRDSPHKRSLTLAEVSAWGRAGLGNDAGGYRNEFLGLVEKAQALQ